MCTEAHIYSSSVTYCSVCIHTPKIEPHKFEAHYNQCCIASCIRLQRTNKNSKLIGAVVPKALNPLAMLNDVTGCGSGSDSAAQNQNIVDSCTKLSLGMGLGCAKSAVSTAKDAIGDVFGSIGL